MRRSVSFVETVLVCVLTISFDPSRIIIEDVEESLLARGDIKLSVADYTAIEEDLRSRMEKELDTIMGM